MYYSIEHSIDTKIVGKYFQSERVVWNYQNNKMYLNNIQFKKIDFDPIVPQAILHKRARVTDLISNTNAGGNLHLLMSMKLCEIINNYRKKGLQFFETSIFINDNKEIKNYFSLNMFLYNNEFIDFEKSVVKHYKKSDDYRLTFSTKVEYPKFESYDSFYDALLTANRNDESFYIEKIKLLSNITEDFFMLRYVEGGVKYFVSEKLKEEIENTKCTGIEFFPI